MTIILCIRYLINGILSSYVIFLLQTLAKLMLYIYLSDATMLSFPDDRFDNWQITDHEYWNHFFHSISKSSSSIGFVHFWLFFFHSTSILLVILSKNDKTYLF